MKTWIHREEKRGHALHGWLNAKHSFSFGRWYDPSRLHFGALRVLNDDEVAPGMGFGMHPHDNMEIITLVQSGALEHKDNMGNGSVMRPNDVQVMSAGTGVLHSEMNPLKDEPVKLFQIWVFPDKEDVKPRYEQKTFDPAQRKNKWQQIIKPDTQTEGEGIFIYQQAWFSLADTEGNSSLTYTSKRTGNGAYVFIIDGQVRINGEQLNTRDALCVTQYSEIEIHSTTDARILIMDVPMIELFNT
ncbi:MAG: pirin family protein [Bacteroidota bacterium]|jgi:redox-sensitive bicupin YhaK (pirin superfamily)